jgi:ribosomal protein S27AE
MEKSNKKCPRCQESRSIKDFYDRKHCKQCVASKLANRNPARQGLYLGEMAPANEIFNNTKGVMIWSLCNGCKWPSWMPSSNVRQDGITMNRVCYRCNANGIRLKYIKNYNCTESHSTESVRLQDLVYQFLDSLLDEELETFIETYKRNRIHNEEINNRGRIT